MSETPNDEPFLEVEADGEDGTADAVAHILGSVAQVLEQAEHDRRYEFELIVNESDEVKEKTSSEGNDVSREELVKQAAEVKSAVEGSMYYPVAHGEAKRLQQMIEDFVDADIETQSEENPETNESEGGQADE